MTATLYPELLDEALSLSLREVCHACGIHAEYVLELVAEGVVQPAPDRDPTVWRFDGLAVTRILRALRLQQDLGINLPGIALALDLLDELERLRRHR